MRISRRHAVWNWAIRNALVPFMRNALPNFKTQR